jgi:hypothetical protein
MILVTFVFENTECLQCPFVRSCDDLILELILSIANELVAVILQSRRDFFLRLFHNCKQLISTLNVVVNGPEAEPLYEDSYVEPDKVLQYL